MFRKVKSLEQSFRNMQVLGDQVSVDYKDLCLFPDVQFPVGFKMPKFDLYDGQGGPVAQLRGFCNKMRGADGKEELLMAYFSLSLSGSVLEWYTRQDHRRWYTWDDLAQAFTCHFQYNLEIVPNYLSLTKIEKKPSESFREYGFHWREQAARVDPPKKESEMVDYFLQALEPTYYCHLVSAIGKFFNEVVKTGVMVEEGLKSNKIMSYSAIKATTQAIQNGTGGIIGKKKKEDVETIDSGSCLFRRLRQLDMLRAIESKLPNPPPKNLDYSVSCEYCFGIPVHVTEKCWQLKNVIQELIDTNWIEVQTPEALNINQNPLTTHQETNMIEIVHKGGEPKKPSKTVMIIWSSEVKPVKKPTVERSVKKLSGTNGEPSVVVKKGSPSDVAAKQGKSKVVVPGVANKPVIIVEGAHEHRRALMKILNEAHVPNKISVNHLEKIANKIFEVNRVTFSDDELPGEGTEHNRALYLTMKCEDFVVTRVLVDNGSSENIYPLSILNKLKVDDERIHKNNICVRGFDGGGKDSVGDIVLELTIGPVEFTMEFQVLDVAVSYNMLDVVVPFIEVEDDKGPWVYQVFEIVSVKKIPEGKCVPIPKVTAVSVMVAFEILKNYFVLGKGMGASLQGVIQPVSLPKNLGTFGLRFKPTAAYVKRARKLKLRAKRPVITIPSSVVGVDEELIERFERLFDDVNMVEFGEGSSKADVQEEIIKALFEYKDVFTWSYDDMPGLSTELVVHKLPTDPALLPVKKKLRKSKTDMSVKIKEEVTKQFYAKVIRITQYPTWLANVVPVPKKDGKTRAQALADHLAENPVDEEYEPLRTYFPDEEVMHIDELEHVEKPDWKLFFDGAANMKCVGI
ncbi:uncharacterized protein [Nicotiana sylvestris]|uniref:uncharacterized protein n=1 Tax=Nicotiana sylvestris TaxID=4096 RepID=UPI00388C736A